MEAPREEKSSSFHAFDFDHMTSRPGQRKISLSNNNRTTTSFCPSVQSVIAICVPMISVCAIQSSFDSLSHPDRNSSQKWENHKPGSSSSNTYHWSPAVRYGTNIFLTFVLGSPILSKRDFLPTEVHSHLYVLTDMPTMPRTCHLDHLSLSRRL
jgi:hypothetical protein